MEQYLKVGIITSTHGLKGEVKVYATTDSPERYRDLKEVQLRAGREIRNLEIEKVRFFKGTPIVKFKGIDDINDVEKYRRAELYVSREQAVPLEEDEYYIADLIGMTVLEEDGHVLGTLADVMQTGANDVYIVRDSHDRELLIPAIHQCVREVSPEENRIVVSLLPGLEWV